MTDEEVPASQYTQTVFGSYSAITQKGNPTVNVTNQIQPPIRQWLRPARPTLSKTFVGREVQLDALIKDLVAGQSAAITGKTLIRTLQGMGGIGKTYLALKVAQDLYDRFPGGVLRVDLGPQVADEAGTQVPLSRLASYAFGGIPPAGPFQPEQVAAWLTETAPGRCLVLFDDVWHPVPLRILSRALPADAVRLVTTRFATIAQTVGGKMVRLDRLTLPEGVALLEDRLGCQGNTTYRADLQAIVQLLDGHALALDIAAARINEPWRARAILQALQQGIGRGELGSLQLPPSEERDDNLERSLGLSYERMTGEQQHRFRALGVFAAEAPISAPAVAAVWEMDDRVETETALLELADLAVLTALEEPPGISYRQHGLLRVYARALLEKTGELARASQAHAQYYTDLVVATEIAEYAQLDQHMQNLLTALHWTADHEPPLFLRLLGASWQFLLVRGQSVLLETYLPKALTVARATGDTIQQANLLKSLGDLESRLGNIDQARAHYDAALPLYRLERDRLGEANLLKSLGDLFLARKEWLQAKTYYEQALPLSVAERDPLGQANILIDLGRARFELGDHEQGLQDVQQAAALYHAVQDEEWAGYAEQYLTDMRARMTQHGDGEA